MLKDADHSYFAGYTSPECMQSIGQLLPVKDKADFSSDIDIATYFLRFWDGPSSPSHHPAYQSVQTDRTSRRCFRGLYALFSSIIIRAAPAAVHPGHGRKSSSCSHLELLHSDSGDYPPPCRTVVHMSVHFLCTI